MSDNSTPTYAKTSKERRSGGSLHTRSFEQGQLSLWKLLFLGLFALALSTVSVLGFFVAAPLVIATLFYGRVLSYLMSAALLSGLYILSISGIGSEALTAMLQMQFSMLLFGSLVAAGVSEILLRKVSPAKGALMAGLAGALLCSISFVGFITYMGMSEVRESVTNLVGVEIDKITSSPQFKEITRDGSEEVIALESFLSSPKEVSEQLLTWVPGAIAMTYFIAVWIALYLVLKNSLVWRSHFDYPFTASELIKLRLPDQMIWVLILALGLTLAGSSLESFSLRVIGFNMLGALGVLYFFQGIGVYLDFLSHLKIFGFFRPLLVVFTAFMAYRVIALLGVFDMWANFRRFFNNKNDNEGDTQ